MICGNFSLPPTLQARAITCEEAINILLNKGITPSYLRSFYGNNTEAYYEFILNNESKAIINIFTKEIKIE